jgi:hypothetical protein
LPVDTCGPIQAILTPTPRRDAPGPALADQSVKKFKFIDAETCIGKDVDEIEQTPSTRKVMADLRCKWKSRWR